VACPRIGFVSIFPLLVVRFEILTAMNMKSNGF
jgi:hypothetical protein